MISMEIHSFLVLLLSFISLFFALLVIVCTYPGEELYNCTIRPPNSRRARSRTPCCRYRVEERKCWLKSKVSIPAFAGADDTFSQPGRHSLLNPVVVARSKAVGAKFRCSAVDVHILNLGARPFHAPPRLKHTHTKYGLIGDLLMG